ncbi:MAG: hypothetical protein COV44_00215 [Deltaproteobacteria bacterium CG11_big_fil_rev_8_21_14_0_20_45_16]|nr:MAG: hypothetical protein COV44_00215 [Deltaproteobacteria bacterium CG11_big_fil_rev_8_21_14_0_20_45_16]
MIYVRPVKKEDFSGITELCLRVYPGVKPWNEDQLSSHLRVFPEGQLVAIDDESSEIVGYAASLIISWDDYEPSSSWRDVTEMGMFTSHDPENGKTLYGAEVMVDPRLQGKGVGKILYAARAELTEKLGLLRIRAGARLRRYGRYAKEMSPAEYVKKVIRGELYDPTLTFQLRRGFRVLWIVSSYLLNDPDSLGNAAVIEWINHKVADPRHYSLGDPQFLYCPPYSGMR